MKVVKCIAENELFLTVGKFYSDIVPKNNYQKEYDCAVNADNDDWSGIYYIDPEYKIIDLDVYKINFEGIGIYKSFEIIPFDIIFYFDSGIKMNFETLQQLYNLRTL